MILHVLECVCAEFTFSVFAFHVIKTKTVTIQ